jgi:hypothetical protein
MGSSHSKSYKNQKQTLLYTFEHDRHLLKEFLREMDIQTVDLIPYQMGTVNNAENVIEYLKGERIPVVKIKNRLQRAGANTMLIEFW